jgi:hypothetical protein
MEDGLDMQGLYPELNSDELREAEQNFMQYADVVLRIYERVASDPEAYARFKALTAQGGTVSFTLPRSHPLK